MKTFLIFLSLSVLLNFQAILAQPGLIWSKDFFCINNDYTTNFITKPIIDNDQNVYVAGSLNVNANEGNRSPVVIKLNAQGEMIWTYAFPRVPYPVGNIGPGNCAFNDIALDSEGNIIAVGMAEIDTTINGYKPIAVKLNPQGQALWTKVFFHDTQTEFFFGNRVVCDNAGNSYISSMNKINNYRAAYLWKLNGAGEQVWSTQLSANLTHYYPYNLHYASTSNSVTISGDFTVPNSYTGNFVRKFNAQNGTVAFSKTVATNPNSYVESMHVDADENVYLSLYSDDGKGLIRKFDAALEEVFMLEYHPENSAYDNSFGKIISLSNGQLLAAGYSYASSEATTGRAVFLRFTPEGQLLDTQVMPAQHEEYFYDVAELNNELYFIGTGTSAADDYVLKIWRTNLQGTILNELNYTKPGIDYGQGQYVVAKGNELFFTGITWKAAQSGISVLKTTPEQIITHIKQAEFKNNSMHVYPNPASNHLFIKATQTIANTPYEIIDAMGRTVRKGQYTENEGIEISDLSPGVYTAMIMLPSTSLKALFIKQFQ